MNKLWFLLIFALVGACDKNAPSTAAEAPRDRFVLVEHGAELASGGRNQSCVRDAQTGLIWEVKTDDGGLRDRHHTYSWFNPEQAHHELDYRGTANAGSCKGSECDTWSIVAAVNADTLCGFNDWRLPSRDELFSISILSKAKSPPTIDSNYFPRTQLAEYWSSNDYSFQWDAAWAWSFQFGHDRVDWKKSPKFIRLVRGDAADLIAVKD